MLNFSTLSVCRSACCLCCRLCEPTADVRHASSTHQRRVTRRQFLFYFLLEMFNQNKTGLILLPESNIALFSRCNCCLCYFAGILQFLLRLSFHFHNFTMWELLPVKILCQVAVLVAAAAAMATCLYKYIW